MWPDITWHDLAIEWTSEQDLFLTQLDLGTTAKPYADPYGGTGPILGITDKKPTFEKKQGRFQCRPRGSGKGVEGQFGGEGGDARRKLLPGRDQPST